MNTHTLKDAKKAFIVGIKGAAMSNIAVMLKKMGLQVSGSDVDEEFPTDIVLKEHGIPVLNGFDPGDIDPDTDLVVYSAAHGGISNPQVSAAREGTVIPQTELIAQIMDMYTTSVAVCGCHGKTTTSGLLAHALLESGKKPGYMVGAPGFGKYPGSDVFSDSRSHFVIEADEYGVNPPSDTTPKLYALYPTHVIATNIDFDHPDVYKNLDHTKAAFRHFFEHNIRYSSGGKLFVCAEDGNLMDVVHSLPHRDAVESYGFSDTHDLWLKPLSTTELETTFSASYHNADLGTFSTRLFGDTNILNAGGVILCLLNLGFKADDIRRWIREYLGAKRRFEPVAAENDVLLFDDYAHHPHEIDAIFSAARSRFPARRLVVVFQPHTYSRTDALKEEFVASLSQADVCIVAPVFASARETTPAEPGNVIVSLAKELNIPHIVGYETEEERTALLKQTLKKGDVVFTMGAGDIYKLKNDIIRVIKNI